MAKDAQQMPVRIKFRTDASLSHDEFSDGNGGACERGGTIGRLEPGPGSELSHTQRVLPFLDAQVLSKEDHSIAC